MGTNALRLRQELWIICDWHTATSESCDSLFAYLATMHELKIFRVEEL